jgi:hypothetical protein
VKRHQAILVLSLAAIAVAGAFIVHRLRNPVAGRVITDYAEFIGQKLGEALLSVNPAPARVVIVTAGGVNAADPFTEGYIRGLDRVLRPSSPRLAVEREVVLTDFMALQAGAPAFGARDFRRILEAHPGCDLFVSLTGIPEHRADAIPEGRSPALVALAVYGGAAAPWFEAGVLRAAVVPREGGTAGPAGRGSGLAARFEREYHLLLPGQAEP